MINDREPFFELNLTKNVSLPHRVNREIYYTHTHHIDSKKKNTVCCFNALHQ